MMTRRAAPFDVALKVFISEQQEVKADASGISTEPDENLSAITLGEKELEALPMIRTNCSKRSRRCRSGGRNDASVSRRLSRRVASRLKNLLRVNISATRSLPNLRARCIVSRLSPSPDRIRFMAGSGLTSTMNRSTRETLSRPTKPHCKSATSAAISTGRSFAIAGDFSSIWIAARPMRMTWSTPLC